jgi:hypothetical protein
MLATFDPTTFPYPNSNLWDVVPDFTSWEAAGLYHLWSGYGYRFSVVGGYRQESWTFLGTPSDSTDVSLSLHDRFTSHIPFLALQTAMFYPWWKARFEVLGSPFMSKKVTATVRNGGTLVDFKGWADRGGLIEFSMEGTCALTSVLRLGLYGRYSYQELYGWVTKRIGGQSGEYKLGFNENTGVVGTNLTLLF